MPSDAVWVALIAAVPTSLAMLGSAARFWLQRRDAEKAAANEERKRQSAESSALLTVETLQAEIDELKEDLQESTARERELMALMHGFLRHEADGRLGTRSPRDSA